MHAADETRKTCQTPGIAGDQFDPMAGESPSAVIASRDDRLEPSLSRIFGFRAVIRLRAAVVEFYIPGPFG